jgi:ATP-dependent helicase/nuclease subunit B
LAKHIADSDFSPVMWEAAFGTGQPLGCIDSPIDSKRTLKLTGVIDRVDVLELNGKKYIKIIDYKTGAVKFDPDALGFGAQLQLTAYLDAIIKNSKDEAEPAGILYFHLDDPIISFAEDSDEKLERDTIKRFKMSGVTLDDENVIKAMDKNIDKWSDIIPVYLSKNGVGARSSVISQEDFKKLRQFVTRKITDAGKDMARGNISARPYKKEKNAETACLFCEYKPICKIDSVTSKSKFNIMTRANLRTIIDSVD